MAVYSLIDLIASITAKVFQNSNKSVSGAQLQAALIDIAQSSVNKTTDAALLGGGLKDYVTNRVYLAGEGCFQLGKTYRANKGTTGAFNAADWDLSIVTKADVALGSVDNTSDANKPVSIAQATADTVVLNSAKSYADGLVIGLLDDRGNYDASANTFPTTAGSGASGAILKGDLFTISVAGTLGGANVTVGDVIRALINTPAQVSSNWAVSENNFGYVAENSANKSNDILDSASTTKFPVWAAILAYFTGARIRTLLGISTLSGSNTGDQNLSGLQATLVSGTNIKTINGGSILGSGNIVVASGGGGTSDGYSMGAELYLFNNFT